jgi:hypothetical protein
VQVVLAIDLLAEALRPLAIFVEIHGAATIET